MFRKIAVEREEAMIKKIIPSRLNLNDKRKEEMRKENARWDSVCRSN
jgi:hypothetical protein